MIRAVSFLPFHELLRFDTVNCPKLLQISPSLAIRKKRFVCRIGQHGSCRFIEDNDGEARQAHNEDDQGTITSAWMSF